MFWNSINVLKNSLEIQNEGSNFKNKKSKIFEMIEWVYVPMN